MAPRGPRSATAQQRRDERGEHRRPAHGWHATNDVSRTADCGADGRTAENGSADQHSLTIPVSSGYATAAGRSGECASGQPHPAIVSRAGELGHQRTSLGKPDSLDGVTGSFGAGVQFQAQKRTTVP